MTPPPGSKIPFDGLLNFRDLGGYPAAGGRTVCRGKIFRSDDFHRVSDGDLRKLEALGIRCCIDFRGESEKAAAPNRLPDSVRARHEFPVAVGDLIEVAPASPETSVDIMLTVNRHLAEQTADTFRQFFQIIQDEKNVPVVFHCSAGKDRTGFAAAILLAALGVAPETILADYRLSGDNIRPKYQSWLDVNPNMIPLVESRAEYLRHAFDALNRRFGDTESYLRHLGADLPLLRRLYTSGSVS